MSPTLSVLDLAPIRSSATSGPGEVAASFAESVVLAQTAEKLGFHRVWYAEHHNMPSIASSATSVLIGHVATQTSTIRLGAGGIMLPNHSPLVIAEQFGTLATLYGDRIDLGLGRAPGSDQLTFQALRRDPASAESFPHDVLELQAYFGTESRIKGVNAYPGYGTNVPLYILGSSLFGAQLAAQLGLPYSFASHFAPDALQQAVRVYRENFQPSEQLSEPYVIAGVGVVAADTNAEASELMEQVRRDRVQRFVGRNRDVPFTEDELDMVMASPAGEQILKMLKYTAVGTTEAVGEYLEQFAQTADADELITVQSPIEADARLNSLRITAEAAGLTAP
ncbi:LLM class flavin-dependent oxidoreductase [Zhihengliuella salsuginis]|uniref:Luciferase-like protein n=1 Tax=Zhihengliuella salsuginis TaxID=578222 RepID=A0ABQ3GHW4_9MICC|nr:LLM class flavin-dependent oxidoreductase [Zhihengliuella salsuginis]GHD06724.1 putative luciferase-like protein [Zhihengliuella salsuginis]